MQIYTVFRIRQNVTFPDHTRLLFALKKLSTTVEIQMQSQLPILPRCLTIKLLKICVTVQSQKMYKL